MRILHVLVNKMTKEMAGMVKEEACSKADKSK